MNDVAYDRRDPCDSTLDPRTLDKIVRRVVEVAQPERIILFGSAARGEMTRHSDVDLLIVRDGEDALDMMFRIYRRLRGVACDVALRAAPAPVTPVRTPPDLRADATARR